MQEVLSYLYKWHITNADKSCQLQKDTTCPAGLTFLIHNFVISIFSDFFRSEYECEIILKSSTSAYKPSAYAVDSHISQQ